MKTLRGFLGCAGLALLLPAVGSVDRPDTTDLAGNAYHEGGWLSQGLALNATEGFLQFDSSGDVLFSPRYALPIRKIVLEARCSSASSPSRFLTLTPYVNGVEDAGNVLTNAVFAGRDVLSVVGFDFSTGQGVDAFRIGMAGSSGNWGLTRLMVFWGEKTPDEDEALRDVARQLPTPENVRLSALAPSSVTLSADAVSEATAYVFEVARLTGCPRTELREDFVGAPTCTEGWTFGSTNNVKLSSYSGENSTSVDRETSDDRSSLKIEAKSAIADVLVELVSPEAAPGECVRECSFWSKRASGDSTDRLQAFGQAGGSSEWVALDEPHAVGTSKDRQTIAVGEELDIRRVKFVFTAESNTCRACALDSCCIVYGGNETRDVVATVTNETAVCEVTDLTLARYGYRVRALGATTGDIVYKDSSWSEEQVVDLAWAHVELSAPTDVACTASGEKLNVTWTAVKDAAEYVVTLALADDPSRPVTTVTTRGTSVSIPVEELGEYAVSVTAVSPGGVSRATAEAGLCELKLGRPEGLSAEATAADTVTVTWRDVPLAAGYQAKLFRVEGTAGTVVSDYSALPDTWPPGWTHDDWDAEQGFWTSGGKYPKFTYRGQWIATESFPAAVTKVAYSVRSGTSKAGCLENQFLRVELSRGAAGGWETCRELPVSSETVANDEIVFSAADDVRRIRFVAETRNGNYSPSIKFGKVTVSYGEYARNEVASVDVGAGECVAVFRGLDRTDRYVAAVTPQPSEGRELESSSEIVDLGSERFRTVGPVSLAACKGVYAQTFDSLAGLEKEMDLVRVPLDAWQLFKGSGAAEKLFYTAGTNSTKCGVYCYSDANRLTNSFMIGTVASGTMGSSLGLSFVNDTDGSLDAPTVTFTSVQRNFKANPATYALEWLVTDGPWSIGTESAAWQTLAIPATAPLTGATADGRSEFRQEAISVTPVFAEAFVPGGRLKPGQVLILRWRHEKGASGPMMGLDDVRVEFPVPKTGFGILVR